MIWLACGEDDGCCFPSYSIGEITASEKVVDSLRGFEEPEEMLLMDWLRGFKYVGYVR